MKERSSGLLLPVFSLPSPYGVGTLGREAERFVDFLAAAGQRWWQMLPAGPTSYGDSPYQSFSTFAGNPYFIDLTALKNEGLLTAADLAGDWGGDPRHVDYGLLYERRFAVLHKAYERGRDGLKAELDAFIAENSWLPDYALYMAVKKHFGMAAWTEWPDEEIRLHRPDAVHDYAGRLADDVRFYAFLQLLFFRQWKALRAYAEKKGVGLIGDVPIYVAADSADVWSEPQWFRLNADNKCTEVAGVPPDYFSKDGQLWGNPLYDWDAMKQDGYGWWIRRVDGARKLFDVLRIDHFRGLESYWAVPAGEKTAKIGRWVKGPGLPFVEMLTNWFGGEGFIAEDLGILTPEVRSLLKESGLPGMRVLEFAFGAKGEPSVYLPHCHVQNCVCYTGTHDNDTLRGWWDGAGKADRAYATRYLGLNADEGAVRGVLRGGMSSTADLFVSQVQDWLELGSEARINTPGTPAGNWQWRLLKGELTPALAKEIKAMTKLYGRLPAQD